MGEPAAPGQHPAVAPLRRRRQSGGAAGGVVDSAALNEFAEKVTGPNGVLAGAARLILGELGLQVGVVCEFAEDPLGELRAKVKLASGDLNGDGTADLVAIWQDGSNQQMRVFVGQGGGFIEDAVWTQRLQEGLGVHTVTALAVGDVDADGCADVVVGRGLELAIVQNQQDRFVPTWTQRIDPSSGVTEIAAVAVGRLTGSVPNQNLDVVAAGNTPYDEPMPPEVPMSKLYLHALRPQ